MRRELLRIQEMGYVKETERHLNYISLCLLEGEITGFMGLANSGKDRMVKMIMGREKYKDGTINICGERVVSVEQLEQVVYKMVDSNYQIEEWSVAEYIGLVTNKHILGLLHKKKLIQEAKSLFQKLGLTIDVQKKLKDLSELEKRMVDVAKACRKEVKILIIEDEFEGFSAEEIEQFKKELSRLISGRMTVVVNNHSDVITGILAERLVIFKKGQIVKKCKRNYITNAEHLETFLLGNTIRTKKCSLDRKILNPGNSTELIYRVHNIATHKQKKMDFTFHKGEIVTILALDRREKEEVFSLLSGREDRQMIKRFLGVDEYTFRDISDYVRSGIVSVAHLGDFEELLPSMSVGENLLVPSLNKISSFEYTMAERRLTKMLEKGVCQSGMEGEERIRTLGLNDRIVLTLERWHVYNPRVMVLLEPFGQCDTYGVSLVKSYIRQIAAGGTCVVVIKAREEYMEELSDRFITI